MLCNWLLYRFMVLFFSIVYIPFAGLGLHKLTNCDFLLRNTKLKTPAVENTDLEFSAPKIKKGFPDQYNYRHGFWRCVIPYCFYLKVCIINFELSLVKNVLNIMIT